VFNVSVPWVPTIGEPTVPTETPKDTPDTLSASPSTSLSLVSTLPEAVVSSVVVPVLATATGLSLTAVTCSVKVFGTASKAPAESCTLNVKLA
jgi:hypothetical protein